MEQFESSPKEAPAPWGCILASDKIFKYRISNAHNTHRAAAGVPQSAVVLSCSSPSLQSTACDYCWGPLSCLTASLGASLIFPSYAAYCTVHQPHPSYSFDPQRTRKDCRKILNTWTTQRRCFCPVAVCMSHFVIAASHEALISRVCHQVSSNRAVGSHGFSPVWIQDAENWEAKPFKDLMASDALRHREKAAYRVLRKWGLCQRCKDSDFQQTAPYLSNGIKPLQRGLSWQSAALWL